MWLHRTTSSAKPSGPWRTCSQRSQVVAGERTDLARVWDIVSQRLGRAPSTLFGVSFLGYLRSKETSGVSPADTPLAVARR